MTGGMGGGGFGAAGGNGASDSSGAGGGGGGSGLGGAIFVQSGGTLTVVDAAEISGNTVMAGTGGTSSNSTNPGYLAAGSGVAMGQDIFVREQGAIVFNLNNTFSITTPIEGDQTNGPGGSGGLQKIGAGTLSLSGANTYSGTTAVEGGTLNLNGSVAGNAAIGAAGALSGNATVSGDLTNSGILVPGNSIGTIHAANLSLSSSSVVKMEVASPGTSDLIAATGTAQLAGTLELHLGSAARRAGSYTLLTASALAGTFDAITFAGPRPERYTISYLTDGTPASVQLTIPPPPATPVPTLNTWLLWVMMFGSLLLGAFAIRLSE